MAKKTVGALVFSLSTESKKFVSGFAAARKSVNKFGATILSVGEKVAKWTAGIVAAGAAIGTYLVARQFDAIDALAKMSDRLGISTEALSSYQFAAEQTGTSGSDLTNSIGRLNRMLGDARNGNKTALRSFERLGLTLKDLQTMSTEDAFRATAEAISRMGTVAEKTSVAQELLGRSGRQMINFLDQGSAGFDAMRAQAEKLGLTLDRSTAAKVEMANDAMNRLKKVITGIARQVAPHFAAIITFVSDKIQDWATSGEGAASRVSAAFMGAGRGIAAALDGVMFSLQAIRVAFYQLRKFAQDSLTFIIKVAETALRLSARVATLGKSDGGAATEGLRKFAEGSAQAAQDLAAEIKKSSDDMGNRLAGGPGSFQAQFADFAIEFQRTADKIAKDAERKLAPPVESAAERMSKALGRISEAANGVKESLKSMTAKGVKASIDRAVGSVKNFWAENVAKGQAMMQVAANAIQLPDQVLSTSVAGGFRGADVSARAEMTEQRNLNEKRNALLEDIRESLRGGVPAG